MKKLMSCQTQIADLKEQKLEKDADTSAIDEKIKELTEKEERLAKDVKKARRTSRIMKNRTSSMRRASPQREMLGGVTGANGCSWSASWY